MQIYDKVKILKYYEKILKKRLDYIFLEELKAKILPLIKLLFPDLTSEWIKKINAYKTKLAQAQQNSEHEVKETFERLKSIVNKENLLKYPEIKEQILSIEEDFEFSCQKLPVFCKKNNCENCSQKNQCKFLNRRAYVFPPYFIVIYEKLTTLLNSIVRIGRDDLVLNFARPYCRKEYIFKKRKNEEIEAYAHPDCGYVYNYKTANKNSMGSPIPFKKLNSQWKCPICDCNPELFIKHKYPYLRWKTYIYEFTFAPSINDFLALEQEIAPWLDKDANISTWVAWNQLLIIEQALNVSRDYLRKKALKYTNAEECQRSANLLIFHDTRAELKSIQEKRQRKYKPILYKHNDIEKCLNIILNEIYSLTEDKQDTNPIFPYAAKLILEDEKFLFLEIEWTEELVEVFELTSFHDKSETLEAIKALLQNLGKLVKIAPIKEEGINSKKILRRLGFRGILEKIFILEVTSYEAALRSDYVILSTIENLNKKKLLSLIPKLKNAKPCHYKKL